MVNANRAEIKRASIDELLKECIRPMAPEKPQSRLQLMVFIARSGQAPNGLRRLPKNSNEALTHPTSIAKTY